MDDDCGAITACLFKARLPFHNNTSATVRVHLSDRVHAFGLSGEWILDIVVAVEDAACWEVRRKNERAQLFGGELWVLDECDRGVGDFTKVVRRNVCRHSNGDSR